jgi:hypothetical protein
MGGRSNGHILILQLVNLFSSMDPDEEELSRLRVIVRGPSMSKEALLRESCYTGMESGWLSEHVVRKQMG